MTNVSNHTVLEGRVSTTVRVGGEGAPLLYLHSEEDAGWNPLLEGLAASYTVYAPEVLLSEDALAEADDIHDVLIYLLDIMDALDINRAAVVGHSFGGMLAGELAAIADRRVSGLALLAPLGLWTDDEPVSELYSVAPDLLCARLYGDLERPAAQAWQAASADRQATLTRMRTMRAALKYTWPIPERGLIRRLHRVSAPTIVVWGDQDGIVAPSYAKRFAAAISGARVEILPGLAHMLPDHPDPSLSELIVDFLAEHGETRE